MIPQQEFWILALAWRVLLFVILCAVVIGTMRNAITLKAFQVDLANLIKWTTEFNKILGEHEKEIKELKSRLESFETVTELPTPLPPDTTTEPEQY